MMNLRLILVVSLIFASWLTVNAAERQLAGIRIGMRPKDVFEALGDPTALLVAQPPLTENRPVAAMSGLNMGAAEGAAAAVTNTEIANTLVFIYRDQELELTKDTTLSLNSTDAGLPLWAYMVRVAKLAIDQQELIYRLNDTYSLGITITGQGNEARVTDIIACNLMPLTVWPKEPQRTFDRKDAFFADMFKFKYSAKKNIFITAGTSKRITIGSKLDEVLRNHRWPGYFLPFTTDGLATAIFEPKLPTPALAKDTNPVGPSGVSAKFAMGAAETLDSSFATNCVLLYPDDNLALTLINYTVIRIQIGRELAKPDLDSFVPGGSGPAKPAGPDGGPGFNPGLPMRDRPMRE